MNKRSSSASPRRAAASAWRLAAYGLACLLLMFIDQRSNALESLRGGLQTIAYPIKVLLFSPIEGWHALGEIFADREALRLENTALNQRVEQLEVTALRRADLELENARLRKLAESSADVAERVLTARIVGQEFSRQRRRITLDRGHREGTYVGQTAIAGGGVLGQTMRVGPFSSEIILLTDPEHAIPVEIQRTGVRTVAVGTGRPDLLSLPSLPLQSDIVAGDVLVSSGLGGIFPTGYPVGIVTQVQKIDGSPLALVEARTMARANRHRHVALIWFKENHPAAPATQAAPTITRGGSP